MPETLAARVAALEAAFRHIAAERMAGVPVLHPGLQVQAVGFADTGDGAAVGVLVTPWFMNLVRLPENAQPLPLGVSAERELGGHRFDFMGAFEERCGAFETCSLFSPMFEFADHAAATATARELLALLRPAPAVPPPAAPSRRGFLFGRPAELRA